MNSRRSLNKRRSRKSAGCVYMLGFLSGLVFIVLCGSTATYNGFSSARSESNLAEARVKVPAKSELPQLATPESEEIDIAIIDESKAFAVHVLNFEPGTQVVVQIESDGRELDSKTDIANDIGSISVTFASSNEILSLERIDFVASDGVTEKRRSYLLPPNLLASNTATLQPTQSVDTPTPSPTPIPPPPAPPATAPPMPTLTPIPFPTPGPMESYYPNWRAE